MVDQELLQLLACPETRQPLREAPADLLQRINARIAAGTQLNRGGVRVSEVLTEGLVRDDGQVAYPVRDGIPMLLIDEGLPLEG